MKLNKKGTSLAELLVSVALLSIILVFMFRLLTDIHNEQTNDSFANDNQINRAEILKNIEDDLNNKTLLRVVSNGTRDKLSISFYYDDGLYSSITASKNEVTFRNYNGSVRKWTLKNCTLYTDKANVYTERDANIYTMNIIIEIHTNNDLNTVGENNTLDDIAISYIGNMKDISSVTMDKPSNLTCLGYCCTNACDY